MPVKTFKELEKRNTSATVYSYEIKRKKALVLREDRVHAGTPEMVAAACQSMGLHLECKEKLYAFMIDTKNRMIGCYLISSGLLDRCSVHAREVFRVAIVQNAARIVLAHNHPLRRFHAFKV